MIPWVANVELRMERAGVGILAKHIPQDACVQHPSQGATGQSSMALLVPAQGASRGCGCPGLGGTEFNHQELPGWALVGLHQNMPGFSVKLCSVGLYISVLGSQCDTASDPLCTLGAPHLPPALLPMERCWFLPLQGPQELSPSMQGLSCCNISCSVQLLLGGH